MVLTNDGELANKLSHPRYEHTKTYKVTLFGHPPADVLEKWEKGVWLDGSRTAPCHIRVLESTPKMTTLRIVMIEGRKRQIRRIAMMLGYPVQRLLRTHIGQLGLGTLQKGAWYEMSAEEVAAMQQPAEEVKYLRRRRRMVRVRDETTFAPREVRYGSTPPRKPRVSRPKLPGSSSRTKSPGQSGSHRPAAKRPPESKSKSGNVGRRPPRKRPEGR